MAYGPGYGLENTFYEFVSDESWKDLLNSEWTRPYMMTLGNNLQSQSNFVPQKPLIFNAFNLTPLKEVRVVILGQDPYFNVGEAMGLAFSVPIGVPVPPSLANIYKELKEDIEGFEIPDHGSLENWAKQGVLLLNATLTVEASGPANSHAKYGWHTFTDQVISLLSANMVHLVFILLGEAAKAKANLINSSKHTILEAGHPSRRSSHLFFGRKVFSRANEALSNHHQPTINWKL